jgi:hypothetical protein
MVGPPQRRLNAEHLSSLLRYSSTHRRYRRYNITGRVGVESNNDSVIPLRLVHVAWGRQWQSSDRGLRACNVRRDLQLGPHL